MPPKLHNMKHEILTFKTIQDAINHVLDSNIFTIDLVEFESKMTNSLGYKHKGTIFLLDEFFILHGKDEQP